MNRVSSVVTILIAVLIVDCGPTLKLHMQAEYSPYDVPMAGKIPSRQYSDTSSFTFPLQVAWQYDASAGFGNGSPIIIGNILLIGTLQGELHAVDITTGKRIKYIKIFSPISASLAVSGRFLYFGTESNEENLTAIATDNGDVQWTADIGGVAASLMVTDHGLYAGGLDGKFYCFHPAMGTQRWMVDTKAPIRSAPCAIDNAVYCANTDGVVFAFDQYSGKELWKFSTGNAVFAGLTAADGKLFVGSRDSNLYILDAATGTLHRKISVGNKIMSAPSVINSSVYVSALDGTVSAYTVSDGTLQWKFQAKSAVNTTPVITPNALFVVSLDEYVYALSPANGSVLWKYHLESRIKTTPLVWKNTLIIAAENKTITCFR
ncbi:MAG: PQQ-binding-like beta-propeller repeat protein [Bacteroidota bacterium]